MVLFNLFKYAPSQGMTRWCYRNIGRMKIGNQVGFAFSNMDIIFPEGIEIGDNSSIGWRTQLLTHEFTQDHIRLSKLKIGENVLVGAFSVVRGGITIGDNAIVAMNSFVNKDIPPDEVWGGVPVRKIGHRNEYPRIHHNYKQRPVRKNSED